ncbi:MAG: hypothetical protein RLZZ127_875 [Planctomycetota bacterium]
MHAIRHPVSVFATVVQALAYRQLKSRFGGYRLGLAWVLIEPLLQIAVFTFIMGAHGERMMPGIEFPVFLVLGITLFDLFADNLSQSMGAIGANRGLLVYHQIIPFDFLFTRWLMELVIAVMVLAVLMGIGAWAGFTVLPHDPLGALLVVACFALFVLGIALIAGVVGEVVDRDLRRLVPFLNRPLYFMSGIFFPLAAIPPDLRPWIDWNPILHALELFRSAWFESYPGQYASWPTLAGWTVGILGFGTLLYRRHRHRLGRSDT